MRSSLDDVMSGRLTYTGDAIRPTTDEPFLAVDVYREWGAVFRFSVSTNGGWFSDTIQAHRLPNGRWEEIGYGGGYGGGWDTPWKPPALGWDGDHLRAMGTVGQDVTDEDEVEQVLIAVSGFASSQVKSIRAEHDGHERSIGASPVGAFVVLAVGSGSVRLTPLDSNGLALGESLDFE